MASNRARYDELRSLAFGSISTNFAALGSEFSHAMRILKFVNNTDGDMIISFDGITSNDFIPAYGFALYDTTSDEDQDENFRIDNRTQIYVKYSSAPTTGSVYLTAVYGKGQ